MFKSGSDILVPLLHRIFNKILNSDTFPEPWRENVLTPVHKKGVAHRPEKYRGIAVSRHFSKLFCAVLNARFYQYFEDNNIIKYNQIGFKKISRTAEHILTLKTLIDKYMNNS